jgi:hypothetical protein
MGICIVVSASESSKDLKPSRDDQITHKSKSQHEHTKKTSTKTQSQQHISSIQVMNERTAPISISPTQPHQLLCVRKEAKTPV